MMKDLLNTNPIIEPHFFKRNGNFPNSVLRY